MSHPRHAGRARTGATAVLLGLLGLLVAGLLWAPAAHAATYRYWGYYSWDGSTWTFAQTGPAETVPADGAVEGWRLAVTDETSPARVPRAAGSFDQVCGAATATAGEKRVAVVVDGGSAADAPDGEEPPATVVGTCAVVPEAATGADALAAVAEVRVEGGLVCAVNGYPSTGCGDAVEGPAPTEEDAPVQLAVDNAQAGAPPSEGAADQGAADTEDDGAVNGLVIGLGVLAVAAVGTAAVVARRRNRAA